MLMPVTLMVPSLADLRRLITAPRLAAAVFVVGLIYAVLNAKPAHVADNPGLDLLVLGLIVGVLTSLRRGPTPYGFLVGLVALAVIGASDSLFVSLNWVVDGLGTTASGAVSNISVLAASALIIPAIKTVLLSLVRGDARAAAKAN